MTIVCRKELWLGRRARGRFPRGSKGEEQKKDREDLNMKTRTLTLMLAGVAAVGIAATARATLYGDLLIERTFASDYPVAQGGIAPVFVVPSAVLPSGTLISFETWDQVEPGSSPFPSAGNILMAYVLRPTVNPNEFKAVFVSSTLTVPSVGSSQDVTFSVTPFPTIAGDRIAFYGQGVPVDIAGGYPPLYYPSPSAPTLNQVITLGSGGFPLFPQDRLYSFDANVVPEPTTMIAGALLLLPFGASTLRILRKHRTA
jgi:hypothetical protein